MKCHKKHGLFKKQLVNGFRFLYHLHSCGFKLKGQQRYLQDTLVKLTSWFMTTVQRKGQKSIVYKTVCVLKMSKLVSVL